MKIYQITKRGEYHLDFCEDYGMVQKIGKNKCLCAVMDGCTMGEESYFASTLVGKIIRKILKERDYQEFYGEISERISLQEEFKQIIESVFEELKKIKNVLLLETNELLTTLVLLLVNIQTKQGIIMVIGDATVAINGKITRFEQNNRPDYLAYHVGKDFHTWFASQKQLIHLDNCQDISIATDGIDSFQALQTTNTEEIEVADYLLNNMAFVEKTEMLNIKVKYLENTFSLIPTDDLAIIRIIIH